MLRCSVISLWFIYIFFSFFLSEVYIFQKFFVRAFSPPFNLNYFQIAYVVGRLHTRLDQFQMSLEKLIWNFLIFCSNFTGKRKYKMMELNFSLFPLLQKCVKCNQLVVRDMEHFLKVMSFTKFVTWPIVPCLAGTNNLVQLVIWPTLPRIKQYFEIKMTIALLLYRWIFSS